MKILTVAIILSIALLSANALLACEGGHESGDGPPAGMRGPAGGMGMHAMPDPERMVRHISAFLELDDATTQELSNVVLAAEPQLRALRDKARANREAIAAVDGSASDYGATIHELALESGQIATETTLLLSQLRVDINSKLSEEQQLQLTERMSNMRHRWGGKRRAHEAETGQ